MKIPFLEKAGFRGGVHAQKVCPAEGYAAGEEIIQGERRLASNPQGKSVRSGKGGRLIPEGWFS
jgi:hypothetical protein